MTARLMFSRKRGGATTRQTPNEVTVIVQGKVLMSEGEVLTVDGDVVRSKARGLAREIEAWLENRRTGH